MRPKLLACLVLLACLGSATASAEARPVLGLQGIGASPADVDVVAGTGVKLLRVQAYWAALEPQRSGQHDPAALARLDTVVARARARGLKIVLFADGTPCWVTSAPNASCDGTTNVDGARYPPRDPAAFVAFSSFLLQRYSRDLAAYEIWNEPDQSNEQYWAGPDKVERYVALLKASYAPLKRISPKLPILGGSFVGGDGRWLKAMYGQGAKGNYDGLAVHFYDLPLYGLTRTRAAQRQAGDKAPLWLTEFGWSSCSRAGGPKVLRSHPCTSQAGQARNLVDLVAALKRTTWVKAAILYAIRDAGDFDFGILDRRGKAKPLLASLRRAARQPSKLRPKRPTLSFKRAPNGRVTITAQFTATDVGTLRIRAGGTQRFLAMMRTDRFNRARIVIPSVVPTKGITVTLRENFSGRSVTRRR